MKWATFFKSTIVKYVFSYACILITVITGMYLIINYQLKREYLNLYMQESRNQVAYTANQISDGFLELEKTAILLSSDVDIINARYNTGISVINGR